MKYAIKRKSYGLVGAIANPVNFVTLPIDAAKFGYDSIVDDIKETAEMGTTVESETLPKKSFSEYSPGATNTEKAGQDVGGLIGAGTGAALGGTLAGTAGAGMGARAGMKSAAKAGTSKIAGALKGAGKWGAIAGAAGALAGGILGKNNGESFGARAGEKINDAARSIGGHQKSYSELTTFVIKRKSYSGAFNAIKAGARLARMKAKSAVRPAVEAVSKVTPEPLKDVGKFAMNHKGSLIGGTVMGAAMTGGSYITDKMIQNDMKKNGQSLPDQKSYSVASAVGKGAEKFLGGISSFMGGGGKKGVQEFANYMKSSKNATSQKIGKFVEKHPKTALTGSIGVGIGAMGATFGQGEKLSKKALETVDKNAFKYTKSKEQEIN